MGGEFGISFDKPSVRVRFGGFGRWTRVWAGEYGRAIIAIEQRRDGGEGEKRGGRTG